MKESLVLLLAIAVYAAAEAAWLVLMRPFYAPRFARICKDGALRIRSTLAVALIYPLLLGAAYVLVVRRCRAERKGKAAVLLSALLFGAVVYGVYNLTNLATLPGYSWDLVAVDTAWGAASMALFCCLAA